MSQWEPPRYDPRQHQQRVQPGQPYPQQPGYHEQYPRQPYPGQPYPQPGPWEQPPIWPHQQQPRRRSRAPLFAGLAALAVIAAGGAAYALTAHGSTAARPLTCRQQYAAWKAGPVHAAGEQLNTDLAAMTSAGTSEDLKTMTSAIEAVGADATALQQYPVPACADPAGYWKQSLADMKAAGDNAGTASGLGGILLAEGPLKKTKVLGNELTAELKRTTGY